jgi:hypothetical protein
MSINRYRFLAAMLAAVTSSVMACGYCVEDKIAAVYDHAVATRAIAHRHQVVFFAIEGNIPPGEESRRMLEANARALAGVERGSVRVSVDAAALSAAFDPARASLVDAERALNRKLAARGLHASIMRVIEEPGELKEASKLSKGTE